MNEVSPNVAQTLTPEADRLVRLVLAGDLQSFAGLIRLYEKEIWRIACTLLLDWSATEDVVQQVFIDAYTHLHQYRLGTNFGAWIRTLAWNRVRKELRALSRVKRRLAAYREEVVKHLHLEETGNNDADLYLAALRKCREQLPAKEAEILSQRYEKGLSFEDIAKLRGTTAAAVQRAISRARYRLRSCIEQRLKLS